MTAETVTATRSRSADDLIYKVSAGNQGAFARLHAHTCFRMYGLIRRVIVDVSQSKEVTQEAYLEVWQYADGYNPQLGSATSWMFTIAHRLAFGTVLTSESSRAPDLTVGVRDRVEPSDEVAATVETSRAHPRATRCMRALTPTQPEALRLVYWEGFTTNKIAEQLGVSVSTAKLRLCGAVTQLRREMEKVYLPNRLERMR